MGFGRWIVFVLLIFSAVLLAYQGVFRCGFVWDDHDLIEENPQVLRGELLGSAFSSDFWKTCADPFRFSGFYRPLVRSSFAFDYRLYGLKPWGFHLSNIIFHGSVALLLGVLCFLLSKDFVLSLVSSLVFALHPVHTESVAWISGRTDVLSLLFSLLCIILFLKASSLDGWRGIFFACGSIISLSLAILAKEMAGIVPVILLTFLLWEGEGRRNKKAYYLQGVYFLVLFVYLILHFSLVGFRVGHNFSLMPERVLFAFFALVYYIRLLVIPYPLRLHYGLEIVKFDFLFVLGIFTVFGAAFLIYKTRHIFNRDPCRYPYQGSINNVLLRFALIFFAFSLLLLIVFTPYWDPLLAERFLYFPEVSFAISIGVIFAYARERYQHKAIPTMCLVILLGIYATIDIYRVRFWEDDLKLFSEAAIYTSNPMIRTNFANSLLEHGEIERAIAEYQKIESSYPEVWTNKINYGKALIKQKKFVAALKMFREALSVNPKSVRAATNLGNTLDLLGKPLEAIKMYEYVLSLTREFPLTYYNLGVVYEGLKDYPQALAAYKKAIELNPYYANAYQGIANVSYFLKDYSRAKKYYQKVISLGGPDGQIYYNLACCYALEGQLQEALQYLEQALKNGFQDFELMKKDPDLELLRKDQKFYSLLEKYTQQ